MGSETDRRNLARALLDIRIAAVRVGFDRSAMDVCEYAETRVADALLAAGFRHPDRGVLEEEGSAAAPAPGDAEAEQIKSYNPDPVGYLTGLIKHFELQLCSCPWPEDAVKTRHLLNCKSWGPRHAHERHLPEALIVDRARVRSEEGARWLKAYEAELGVRGNVFSMTEEECQRDLAPMRGLVDQARAIRARASDATGATR